MQLTEKQEAARKVLAGNARHILLAGGSRSGKTFLLVKSMIERALKAPASRHAILRYRFSHVHQSIVLDTWPTVMSVAFPGLSCHMDKTSFFAQFDNGSRIFFGGLDDKERTEKILGTEYATIYLNECSQIPYNSQQMVLTRLAQQARQDIGVDVGFLKPRMYYDCNPPSKAHWAYKLFVRGINPETNIPLPHPEDYAYFNINPIDNVHNLAEGYLDTLNGLSARGRKRFLDGEWADATPNALFDDANFDTYRVVDGNIPDMVRVVVAVDPSGSGDADNADNDAIGISVVGLGTDGNAYLLEDCTVKAGPSTWGRIATDAYDRHSADVIVGETNYGGAMVAHVIQTANPRANYKTVTATRGKAVRAEPVSALYEKGKVRHVGYFKDLEDELIAFSTIGYMGDRSPNRADALIWGLTELFGSLVSEKQRGWDKPFKPNLGWVV